MPTTTFTQSGIAKKQPKLHEVFWLDQCAADVPSADAWLSPQELVLLNRLRFEKRRADWRLGRWTAKRCVRACCGTQPLCEIEILPAKDGAPEIRLQNAPSELTISLSHRNGFAICAIAASSVSVGCDLEVIESRSDAFIADYFTPEEQKIVFDADLSAQPLLANLIWSAKESALKAMRTGLRYDTRSLSVTLLDRMRTQSEGDWHPLQVHGQEGKMFRGWWQADGSMLRTVVASPFPGIPVKAKFSGP